MFEAAAAEESPAPTTGTTLTPQQATQNFPADDIAKLRAITTDALTKVNAGDQSGAASAATKLETASDDDQTKLKPLDNEAWTFLDGQVDAVLQSVRANSPDSAAELVALHALIQSFG
jgi:hypothetical protein